MHGLRDCFDKTRNATHINKQMTMMTHSQESRVSSSQDSLRHSNDSIPSIVALVKKLNLARFDVEKKIVKAEITSNEEDKQLELICPWLPEFAHRCRMANGSRNIKLLEILITVFHRNISENVKMSLMKPNRAAKLKKCLNEVLVLFHLFYQEVREPLEHSSYLDKMTDLVAMYLDMEIRASRRRKESITKVVSRLTMALYGLLDNSILHVLDAILRAKLFNKHHKELCIPILGKVLNFKRTSPSPMYLMLYVRYILAFKLWKRVVCDAEERRRINKFAIAKLPTPVNLNDKSSLFNNVLPRIPKSKKNITLFFMQAKFDLNKSCQAFLKMCKDSQQSGYPQTLALNFSKPLFFNDPLASVSQSRLPSTNTDIESGPASSSDLFNDIWSSLSNADNERITEKTTVSELTRDRTDVESFSSSKAKSKDKLRKIKKKKLKASVKGKKKKDNGKRKLVPDLGDTTSKVVEDVKPRDMSLFGKLDMGDKVKKKKKKRCPSEDDTVPISSTLPNKFEKDGPEERIYMDNIKVKIDYDVPVGLVNYPSPMSTDSMDQVNSVGSAGDGEAQQVVEECIVPMTGRWVSEAGSSGLKCEDVQVHEVSQVPTVIKNEDPASVAPRPLKLIPNLLDSTRCEDARLRPLNLSKQFDLTVPLGHESLKIATVKSAPNVQHEMVSQTQDVSVHPMNLASKLLDLTVSPPRQEDIKTGVKIAASKLQSENVVPRCEDAKIRPAKFASKLLDGNVASKCRDTNIYPANMVPELREMSQEPRREGLFHPANSLQNLQEVNVEPTNEDVEILSVTLGPRIQDVMTREQESFAAKCKDLIPKVASVANAQKCRNIPVSQVNLVPKCEDFKVGEITDKVTPKGESLYVHEVNLAVKNEDLKKGNILEAASKCESLQVCQANLSAKNEDLKEIQVKKATCEDLKVYQASKAKCEATQVSQVKIPEIRIEPPGTLLTKVKAQVPRANSDPRVKTRLELASKPPLKVYLPHSDCIGSSKVQKVRLHSPSSVTETTFIPERLSPLKECKGSIVVCNSAIATEQPVLERTAESTKPIRQILKAQLQSPEQRVPEKISESPKLTNVIENVRLQTPEPRAPEQIGVNLNPSIEIQKVRLRSPELIAGNSKLPTEIQKVWLKSPEKGVPERITESCKATIDIQKLRFQSPEHIVESPKLAIGIQKVRLESPENISGSYKQITGIQKIQVQSPERVSVDPQPTTEIQKVRLKIPDQSAVDRTVENPKPTPELQKVRLRSPEQKALERFAESPKFTTKIDMLQNPERTEPEQIAGNLKPINEIQKIRLESVEQRTLKRIAESSNLTPEIKKIRLQSPEHRRPEQTVNSSILSTEMKKISLQRQEQETSNRTRERSNLPTEIKKIGLQCPERRTSDRIADSSNLTTEIKKIWLQSPEQTASEQFVESPNMATELKKMRLQFPEQRILEQIVESSNLTTEIKKIRLHCPEQKPSEQIAEGPQLTTAKQLIHSEGKPQVQIADNPRPTIEVAKVRLQTAPDQILESPQPNTEIQKMWLHSPEQRISVQIVDCPQPTSDTQKIQLQVKEQKSPGQIVDTLKSTTENQKIHLHSPEQIFGSPNSTTEMQKNNLQGPCIFLEHPVLKLSPRCERQGSNETQVVTLQSSGVVNPSQEKLSTHSASRSSIEAQEVTGQGSQVFSEHSVPEQLSSRCGRRRSIEVQKVTLPSSCSVLEQPTTKICESRLRSPALLEQPLREQVACNQESTDQKIWLHSPCSALEKPTLGKAPEIFGPTDKISKIHSQSSCAGLEQLPPVAVSRGQGSGEFQKIQQENPIIMLEQPEPVVSMEPIDFQKVGLQSPRVVQKQLELEKVSPTRELKKTRLPRPCVLFEPCGVSLEPKVGQEVEVDAYVEVNPDQVLEEVIEVDMLCANNPVGQVVSEFEVGTTVLEEAKPEVEKNRVLTRERQLTMDFVSLHNPCTTINPCCKDMVISATATGNEDMLTSDVDLTKDKVTTVPGQRFGMDDMCDSSVRNDDGDIFPFDFDIETKLVKGPYDRDAQNYFATENGALVIEMLGGEIPIPNMDMAMSSMDLSESGEVPSSSLGSNYVEPDSPAIETMNKGEMLCLNDVMNRLIQSKDKTSFTQYGRGRQDCIFNDLLLSSGSHSGSEVLHYEESLSFLEDDDKELSNGGICYEDGAGNFGHGDNDSLGSSPSSSLESDYQYNSHSTDNSPGTDSSDRSKHPNLAVKKPHSLSLYPDKDGNNSDVRTPKRLVQPSRAPSPCTESSLFGCTAVVQVTQLRSNQSTISQKPVGRKGPGRPPTRGMSLDLGKLGRPAPMPFQRIPPPPAPFPNFAMGLVRCTCTECYTNRMIRLSGYNPASRGVRPQGDQAQYRSMRPQGDHAAYRGSRSQGDQAAYRAHRPQGDQAQYRNMRLQVDQAAYRGMRPLDNASRVRVEPDRARVMDARSVRSRLEMDADSIKSENEELLRRIEESLMDSKDKIKKECKPEYDSSLPLKKRLKTLAHITETNGKGSDALRNGGVESFPSYPSTPMISIAELEMNKHMLDKLQQHMTKNLRTTPSYQRGHLGNQGSFYQYPMLDKDSLVRKMHGEFVARVMRMSVPQEVGSNPRDPLPSPQQPPKSDGCYTGPMLPDSTQDVAINTGSDRVGNIGSLVTNEPARRQFKTPAQLKQIIPLANEKILIDSTTDMKHESCKTPVPDPYLWSGVPKQVPHTVPGVENILHQKPDGKQIVIDLSVKKRRGHRRKRSGDGSKRGTRSSKRRERHSAGHTSEAVDDFLRTFEKKRRRKHHS